MPPNLVCQVCEVQGLILGYRFAAGECAIENSNEESNLGNFCLDRC